MIDISAIVRAYLARQAGIAAVAGARVFASSRLPTIYLPAQGPALLFSPRGGQPDYSAKIIRAALQFRSFAATETLAYQLDRALYDGLHEQRTTDIHWATCDTIGQPLIDQTTGWPFVITYYTIWIGNP